MDLHVSGGARFNKSEAIRQQIAKGVQDWTNIRDNIKRDHRVDVKYQDWANVKAAAKRNGKDKPQNNVKLSLKETLAVLSTVKSVTTSAAGKKAFQTAIELVKDHGTSIVQEMLDAA